MITDAIKLWEEVLSIVKQRIPEEAFLRWLEPTKGDSISQNTLWVRAPNSFFVEWIEENYHSFIYEALKSLPTDLPDLKVKYKLIDKVKEIGHSPRVYQEDASHLQPRYTFDNFIVGESNKFAHAACMAVARAPGKQYTPLFIYGGVGLGKTHLLQAIGNHAKSFLSDLRVYYISLEQFMNEMVDALKEHRIGQFKGKYRRKDILLIDDIQFLEGKEGLQNEIFHTFNALYEDNKQIVFSSDRPPSALVGLEERLISRFQGGLVCDIKLPDIETRIAILRRKTEIAKIQVADEVLLFIAKEIKSSIRDLEGALVKLFAFSSLTNGKIDLNKAQELLKDIAQQNKEEITIEAIQKAVAAHYNLSIAALRGKRRMQSIVLPRDVAIYLCREHTALSLKEIGKLFSGRDHTTIIHSYNKIKDLVEKKEEFNLEVNNIINSIIM
ncbi:MAG: chromosomal replication initiator protein DnaA [Candidatus Stahlbacteria bacterium]|nr:chromosomal replication initiator protein DnaA [Candidatus Stahlbacteria bacterium]